MSPQIHLDSFSTHTQKNHFHLQLCNDVALQGTLNYGVYVIENTKQNSKPNHIHTETKAKLIFIVYQSSDFHFCIATSSRVRLKTEVLRKEDALEEKEEQKPVLFKIHTRVYSCIYSCILLCIQGLG